MREAKRSIVGWQSCSHECTNLQAAVAYLVGDADKAAAQELLAKAEADLDHLVALHSVVSDHPAGSCVNCLIHGSLC